MTQTETLLAQAEDLARRTFEDPSEGTVMQLFARLCREHDLKPREVFEADEQPTVH